MRAETRTVDTATLGRMFAADPILGAAIAAHGLDPQDLPWRQEESSTLQAVRRGAIANAPALIISDNIEAQARWWRPRGTSVTYDMDAKGRTLTLEDTAMPDTVLAAMRGRMLDSIVDVPGACGLVVMGAHIEGMPMTGASYVVIRVAPKGDK